jgi:hypothetical protein
VFAIVLLSNVWVALDSFRCLVLELLTSLFAPRGAFDGNSLEEDLKTMAEGEGSGNTGVVAIVVIFLIVVVAAVFAWRSGFLGGGTKKTEVDVNVTAPATK